MTAIDNLTQIAEQLLGDPKTHAAPRVELVLSPSRPGLEVSIILRSTKLEDSPGVHVRHETTRFQTIVMDPAREEIAAAILTLVRAVGDIEAPTHPLAFFTPPRAA